MHVWRLSPRLWTHLCDVHAWCFAAPWLSLPPFPSPSHCLVSCLCFPHPIPSHHGRPSYLESAPAQVRSRLATLVRSNTTEPGAGAGGGGGRPKFSYVQMHAVGAWSSGRAGGSVQCVCAMVVHALPERWSRPAHPPSPWIVRSPAAVVLGSLSDAWRCCCLCVCSAACATTRTA